MCLPYLKFSDPLPETHLFFYLAFNIWTYVLKGERDKAAVNGEKEGLENGEEEDEEEIFYDKTKSFFDNISCESVDRAKGYVKLPFAYMGLVATKLVFWGLWTTQAQTSLRIRAVWSAPLLFAFWKILYVNLLLVKFQFSRLSLLLRRLVWISLDENPEDRFSLEEAHVKVKFWSNAEFQIWTRLPTYWQDLGIEGSAWHVSVSWSVDKSLCKPF